MSFRKWSKTFPIITCPKKTEIRNFAGRVKSAFQPRIKCLRKLCVQKSAWREMERSVQTFHSWDDLGIQLLIGEATKPLLSPSLECKNWIYASKGKGGRDSAYFPWAAYIWISFSLNIQQLASLSMNDEMRTCELSVLLLRLARAWSGVCARAKCIRGESQESKSDWISTGIRLEMTVSSLTHRVGARSVLRKER